METTQTPQTPSLQEITLLTPQQEKFIEYYLTGYNLTKSALLAGYSTKYPGRMGYALIHKPAIRDRIKSIQSSTKEKNWLTKTGYTQGTVDNFINCKSDGIKKGYWELLGNILGYIRPQVQQNNIQIFQSLDDKLSKIKFPSDFIVSRSSIKENSPPQPQGSTNSNQVGIDVSPKLITDNQSPTIDSITIALPIKPDSIDKTPSSSEQT